MDIKNEARHLIMRRLFFISLLATIILLPIIYGWGSLYIGGDTLIPFNAANLKLFLSQWLERQDGTFFSHNFYFFYAIFSILDNFSANIYLKGSLFLLIVRIIAAGGIIKLIKLLHGESLNYRVILACAFYLLSPAYYNGHVYWIVYAFIPWLFYVVIKVIKSAKLDYSDILLIGLIFVGSSADLPNPKYLFHTILIIAISLGVATFFGKLERKFYWENKYKFLLIIGISSFLFIPQAIFAFNYDPADYGSVAVKRGYVNDANVAMMDFGTATADRMVRLFHNGMVLEPNIRANYLSNPLVAIANISFIAIIVFYYLIKRKDKDLYDYLFLILLLVYLFFAVGPNPPLGLLYEHIVTSSPLFAFLRTTAGAVFYLSILYVLIIFSALKRFGKIWFYALCTAVLGITAYPMINGDYYRNWSPVNKYIDKENYGLKVPPGYFELKDVFDSKRLDAKVYTPQSNLSYLNTKWGYFGPGWLYNALYKGNFIGNSSASFSNLDTHNVGYIFTDFTLLDANDADDSLNSHGSGFQLTAKNDIGALYEVERGRFFPRIYSLNGAYLGGRNNNIEFGEVSSKPELFMPEKLPVVEYKKISPTKYRVLLHGVNENFTLVLSEQFSKLWAVYIVNLHDGKRQKINLDGLARYKILENNIDEQADVGEVTEFIKRGWITTIGNGTEKHFVHYSFSDTARRLRSIEKYEIDFISKKNFGTIQNDNLEGDDDIFGINQVPLIDVPHIKVNQYANAWAFKKSLLEQKYPGYLSYGKDGKFDMELMIEFIPQRIFYYSLIISGASLLITIVLFIRSKLKRRHGTPTQN